MMEEFFFEECIGAEVEINPDEVETCPNPAKKSRKSKLLKKADKQELQDVLAKHDCNQLTARGENCLKKWLLASHVERSRLLLLLFARVFASWCMGGATAVTTSYVGKIFTATYTSDYVNLLACWSRYFPESVLDGYIGVGYSLFYYLLLPVCISKKWASIKKSPGKA